MHQCGLGHPKGLSCNTNPAAVQAGHDDFKPIAFLAEDLATGTRQSSKIRSVVSDALSSILSS